MASLLLRNWQDLFSRALKERAARNGRTAEEEHRRIVESALTEPTPPERQRYAVAKRLNRLLQLLNNGGRPEITIPHMAELLGLNTASGLESYFFGEEEAPFDLLDCISQTFGLRPEWLKFGGREPFDVRTHSVRELHLPHHNYPGYQRKNLAYVMQLEKPERIFFVRCLDEVCYATIFLQTSQWRYVGFYDGWHVSNHVGATGERQLFEFWKLLKLIEEDYDLRRIISYCDLPKRVFHDLSDGNIFPGAVLWDKKFFSHWADDFIDVHQVLPIAKASINDETPKNGEGYARYGTGFQKAQGIVRQHLQFEREDQEKRQQQKATD